MITKEALTKTRWNFNAYLFCKARKCFVPKEDNGML